MNSVRVYLWVVGILLIGALGAVCYVWFIYQDVYTGEVEAVHTTDVNSSVPPEVVPDVVVGGDMRSTEAAVEVSSEPAPSYTVDVTALPESQQAILRAFHGDSKTITITAAMITCAQTSVGEARLAEILGGSAPSPLEALKLAQCLK